MISKNRSRAPGGIPIDKSVQVPSIAVVNPDTLAKYENLINILRQAGSLVVAFSGGVDSSFLLRVAHDVLGDRVMAVTAQSATFPAREYDEAVCFAEEWQIPHQTVLSEELEIEGFSDNPTNRCFLCKSELFDKIRAIAVEQGYAHVAEGSNADDLLDFRPGLQAIKEQGIISPLREANLTKQEIRDLSQMLGLRSWDKPSFACLSSRFPYGEKITREKLAQIEQAEQHLLDLGFRQVRVRHHGPIARIEVEEREINRIMEEKTRLDIHAFLKSLGFAYICLDMKGYRTGSMNETLTQAEKQI